MASKLFHAVVGVGISLGSAAACGGSVTDGGFSSGSPDAHAPGTLADGGIDTGKPLPKADAGVADALMASDGSIDAAPPDASTTSDASAVDAPDVPSDAIVAAFCDAAWPITKSGREVCGPADECSGLQIPWCFGPDGQGSCKMYPLECVGAEWQCMGGVTPTNDPGLPPTCQ